jgi:hypothetical protein
MSSARRFASCLLVPLCSCVACAPALATSTTDALTDRFADMRDRGWTGADASWSLRLPDGRIAWFFGDTFIGGVGSDGCRDRATPVVRNSVVVQRPDGSMRTVVGGTPEAPAALVPGKGPDDWYWPGPPILTDDAVQVPMAHITRTGPGDWDIEATGTALAELDLGSLELRSLRPITTPPHVNMASAAAETKRHTYVYGTRDYPDGHKDAYVARVARGRLADRWMFWDGRRWTPRASDAAVVASGVSNQFSVIQTARGWRLVTQLPMQPDVFAYAGRSPAGPWTLQGIVAHLPEIPGAITYNATIHPEFSGNGSWVLGFNVTGRTMDALFSDADLYKPRFVTIRIP